MIGKGSFVITLVWILSSWCNSIVIKVCQSKTCTKQHGSQLRSLVTVMQDLIHTSNNTNSMTTTMNVEATGCLTQCGRGPNLAVVSSSKTNQQETLYRLVDSPQAAAIVLEEVSGIPVPSILIAACNVMQKAETEIDANRKELLLNSVIHALTSSSSPSSNFHNSHALSSAFTMRALNRIQLFNYTGAIEDAKLVTENIPNDATAFRILAQAYEGLGNYPSAIQALQKLIQANSAFATKATKDIQRLSDLC